MQSFRVVNPSSSLLLKESASMGCFFCPVMLLTCCQLTTRCFLSITQFHQPFIAPVPAFLVWRLNVSTPYVLVYQSMNWTEAQRYCREHHTDLASVRNETEKKKIRSLLINTVNGSYSGLAWIGLYDDLDSWRWSLDDESFYKEGERDFRGWNHQPDNYNGKELCVYMSSTGEWFDASCTTRVGFICSNGRM
uniref:C-type lectin domain-containing protein n=1 Tax=Pygocentrus nattereri TaxID=42514 RepID=A0AAR2JHJ0_PYGNA